MYNLLIFFNKNLNSIKSINVFVCFLIKFTSPNFAFVFVHTVSHSRVRRSMRICEQHVFRGLYLVDCMLCKSYMEIKYIIIVLG